jgi:hypothetical protein
MLAYLGRMLSARRQPLRVRYLNRAEGAPAWRDGWLVAVDAHGASFAASEGGGDVECLPWGSIGGIRVAAGAEADAGAADAAEDRPAFFDR